MREIATSPGAAPRPRRSSGRPLVIGGALLALLAFMLAAVLAGSALLNPKGPGGTRVVVALAAIQARTPITESQLTITTVAPTPNGSFTQTKDLVGKVALVDIPAGNAITSNMVATDADLLNSSQAAYLPIPSGFVAVTIPSGEQVAVGGYIQVKDRIMILAEMSNGTKVSVRTVFRDVPVIRVGSVADTAKRAAQGSATDVSSSLTVLMSACDAEYMYWLLNGAQLKYVLESFKDYAAQTSQADPHCPAITSSTGVTSADVEARWHFFGS